MKPLQPLGNLIVLCSLLGVLAFSSAAQGESSLVIPYGADAIRLQLEEILQDGAATHTDTGAILVLGEPSHGTLVPIDQDLFFVPEETFWTEGIDHFLFALQAEPTETRIAFLVPDQKVIFLASLLTEDHLYVGDRTPEGGNADFELDGGSLALLDTGTPAATIAATAQDANGRSSLAAFYDTSLAIPHLLVVAHDRIADERSVTVPLNGATDFSLSWWIESPFGACNGGVLVVVNGTLAGSLTNLCNYDYVVSSWSFDPDLIPTRGVVIWGSHETPAFPPILGQGFETGGTDTWTPIAQPGTLLVTEDASINGTYGLAVTTGTTPAYLESPPIQGGPYLRSRFRLRLPTTAPLVGATTIQQAVSSAGSELYRIELDLSQSAVRAVAALAPTSAPGETPWQPLALGASSTIVVHWWAASSPGAADGGLKLEVDDLSVVLGDLEPPADAAERIAIGVISSAPASLPTLYFDDIFVWQ